MGKVVLCGTVSVDGFIADERDQPQARLAVRRGRPARRRRPAEGASLRPPT